MPAMVDVIRNGAKIDNGMPRFAELNDDDITGLMHYIREQARKGAQALAAARG